MHSLYTDHSGKKIYTSEEGSRVFIDGPIPIRDRSGYAYNRPSYNPTLDIKYEKEKLNVFYHIIEAARKNNFTEVKNLFEKESESIKNSNIRETLVGESLLTRCISEKIGPEIVEYLINECHEEVNHGLPYHTTPLEKAISCNNLAVVKLLVKKGALIENSAVIPPLHQAATATHGDANILKFLLKQGKADVNFANFQGSGSTALIHACSSQNTTISTIEVLLKEGSDIFRTYELGSLSEKKIIHTAISEFYKRLLLAIDLEKMNIKKLQFPEVHKIFDLLLIHTKTELINQTLHIKNVIDRDKEIKRLITLLAGKFEHTEELIKVLMEKTSPSEKDIKQFKESQRESICMEFNRFCKKSKDSEFPVNQLKVTEKSQLLSTIFEMADISIPLKIRSS